MEAWKLFVEKTDQANKVRHDQHVEVIRDLQKTNNFLVDRIKELQEAVEFLKGNNNVPAGPEPAAPKTPPGWVI